MKRVAKMKQNRKDLNFTLFQEVNEKIVKK